MRHSSFIMLAAVLTVAAACERPTQTNETELQRMAASHGTSHGPSMQKGTATGDQKRQVAQLRAVTAKFHDIAAADAAGWNTRITDCFSDPTLGGMGFHYGNPALIDDKVDVLQPELLLYEPQKNGTLKFVAVEYIVPFTAWTQAEPPSLYGLSFHRNEAFGLWILHVWHFQENPRGLFEDWNPTVSCRFAQP
jgi:hypothetical protein